MEWVPSEVILHGRITLKWPVSTFEQPTFTIPPIFNGVEFLFNTRVRRGDAGQFLKFRRLITEAVEISHVRWIRIEMSRFDAFYLAFPLFMQFLGNMVRGLAALLTEMGNLSVILSHFVGRA